MTTMQEKENLRKALENWLLGNTQADLGLAEDVDMATVTSFNNAVTVLINELNQANANITDLYLKCFDLAQALELWQQSEVLWQKDHLPTVQNHPTTKLLSSIRQYMGIVKASNPNIEEDERLSMHSLPSHLVPKTNRQKVAREVNPDMQSFKFSFEPITAERLASGVMRWNKYVENKPTTVLQKKLSSWRGWWGFGDTSRWFHSRFPQLKVVDPYLDKLAVLILIKDNAEKAYFLAQQLIQALNDIDDPNIKNHKGISSAIDAMIAALQNYIKSMPYKLKSEISLPKINVHAVSQPQDNPRQFSADMQAQYREKLKNEEKIVGGRVRMEMRTMR